MGYTDDITFTAKVTGISFEALGAGRAMYAVLRAPDGSTFRVPVRSDRTAQTLLDKLTTAHVTVEFREAS